MSLSLTKAQIEQVRTCWSNIQINNRYHKDDFTSRLFSNLLISNPSLKSVLSSDAIIREQATLFGDLLNYAILYLGNTTRLDRFLTEFFSENTAIVQVGSKYLESMGTSLMQTFRQWLGKGLFDEQLEMVWIQVYIHVANNWLQFCGTEMSEDEEENNSVYSEEEVKPVVSSESELEHQEVEKAVAMETERPVDPTRSMAMASLENSASLKINLNSNDKYRGFRRSANENTSEVSVKIPKNTDFEKPKVVSSSLPSTSMSSRLSAKIDKADFDPRFSRKLSKVSTGSTRSFKSSEEESPKSSTFEQESVSTSRSSSPEFQSPAAAPVEKFGNKQPKMVYDSDEEMEDKSKTFGFDPRKKKNSSTKYSSEEEVESDEFEPVQPLFAAKGRHSRVSSTFSENFVSDVEDTLELISKPESPEPRASKQEIEEYKQRISHFDANSFGIKGLAPIVETALDEASSIYNSDNTSSDNISEGRSVEESTSGVSTLSLHNSHYSDGTEIPTSPNTFQKQHTTRQASQSSEISFMKPLGAGTRLQKSQSLTSLSMDRTGQRASLGFMRSSFILKKEVDTLGYNIPENVIAQPPKIPAARQEINMASVTDLSGDDSADIYSNSFMPITSQKLGKRYTASCTNLGINRSATRSQPNLNAIKPSKGKKIARNNKYDPMEVSSVSATIRKSNAETGNIKTKRSFRARVKSIFSSDSKSDSKTISSPLETTYSTNSAFPARRSSVSTNRSSMNPTSFGVPYESSKSIRSSRQYKPSVSDVKSVNTMESNDSTSGFSFFSKSKKTSMDTRYSTRGDRTKKDKYKVTAVPYNVYANNKLIFS